MFCCCMNPPPFVDPKPLVVDLNEVLTEKYARPVQTWHRKLTAWRSYRSTLGFCQKLSLKREKFILEVPENFFVFEEIEQSIEAAKRTNFKTSCEENAAGSGGANSKDVGSKNNNDKQGGKDTDGLMKGKIAPRRDLTNPEVVSLDTEFSNATAERQLYKFRFEKTRRTVIDVSFQKGFTLGGKAKFNLGIPVAGGEAEAEMQLQVTKSHGQTFEESMLMEATSDIAVGPNSCYTANIQLEERPLHAYFKVVTRMSMPQRKAPVYIKRKSDGEKVFVYYVKNLVDTFADGAVPCAQIVKGADEKPVYDKVDFVVEGVIQGLLACNHKIALTSDETEETKNRAKLKYLQKAALGSLSHERQDED